MEVWKSEEGNFISSTMFNNSLLSFPTSWLERSVGTFNAWPNVWWEHMAAILFYASILCPNVAPVMPSFRLLAYSSDFFVFHILKIYHPNVKPIMLKTYWINKIVIYRFIFLTKNISKRFVSKTDF